MQDKAPRINIPAIIFDCDGVLVDSERIYFAVEREHLAGIGLEYDPDDYQHRFTGLSETDFFCQLAEDYKALEKGEFPSDFAAALKAKCWQRFENELIAIDGIGELLDQFKGAVAVASSSATKTLHRKLEITDLHHRFSPHIYSSEQVERGKPAPDLFLFAASRLGQRPENCIVVEDSANGVQAGLAAGMCVWGFAGGGHADAKLLKRLRDAGAHQVFSSFLELGCELTKR